MASLGHIAVGMAAGRFHQRDGTSKAALARAMYWMSLASLMPDLDVVGFIFGVAYEAPFGHRGASHALLAAPILAVIPSIALDHFLGDRPRLHTWLLTTLVMLTHGPLDTLTDGGMGVALFWPLSNARHFAPWEIIPVAPIGRAYFTARGLRVGLTELAYFLPCFVYAFWPRRRPIAAIHGSS